MRRRDTVKVLVLHLGLIAALFLAHYLETRDPGSALERTAAAIYVGATGMKMMELAGGHKDIGKRVRGVPMLTDLDRRFEVMDQFDDYCQIL